MSFSFRAVIAVLSAGILATGLRAQSPPSVDATAPAIVLQPPQVMPPDQAAVAPALAGNAPSWQFLAGAGFNLVAPFTDNNRAFTITQPAPGGGHFLQSTDFGNPVSVAPRFWLGVASPSGWGFRTSYWHFDQNNSLTTALDGASPAGSSIASASPFGVGVATGTFLLAPGNADVLTATNSLNLTVLDFEFTREIEAGRFFLVLSGGGRYAQLGQHYDASVANTSNSFTNAEVDQLLSHQRFTGGGPTLALQGWYPLGRTRFSLYGLARGSLLFGNNRQDASTTTLTVMGGAPTLAAVAQVSGTRNAAVPVSELEIGIQWTGLWGRFAPFVRTGAVAQTWFNALTATTVPTSGGDTASLNTNLSFFGVVFQAGLSY